MSNTDITPEDPSPSGPAEEGSAQDSTVPQAEPPSGTTSRPAATCPSRSASASILGGLALLTLLTVKATFLIYMGAALAVGLHELAAALKTKDINVPVIPVALGGAAMLTAAYWAAGGAVLAAFALTVLGDPDRPHVRRHRPLRQGRHRRRVRHRVPAAARRHASRRCWRRRTAASASWSSSSSPICSDIGGYFAGITLTPFTGGHKMAPVISPKKTWEGLAGSVLLAVVAGAILLPALLHGHWWQGVVTGIAAVAAAVFGDLAESMIKRDLAIKDMGTLLPGHGGILDRIDSLLACAPVVWLLLALFVK